MALQSSKNDDEFVIRPPPVSHEHDEGGIGLLLYNSMISHGSRIAHINAQTGEKESYAALLTRCIRTALVMKSKGVTKDDIICVSSINNLDIMVPVIATFFVGAKFAGLDPNAGKGNLIDRLEHMKPKIIFVSKANEKLIEDILDIISSRETQLVVFGESEKYSSFDTYIQPQEGEETFKPITLSNKEIAMICYSSGTTGLPKGICLSHYVILNQVINSANCNEVDMEFLQMERKILGSEQLVYLIYGTLWAISPIITLVASAKYGLTRLICNSFDPKEVWHFVDKYKVFLLCLYATDAQKLAKVEIPLSINIKHFRRLVITGTPLSNKMVLKLREMLPDCLVYQAYSQTETAGALINFQPLSKKHRKKMQQEPGCVGYPCNGMNCKIVNIETGKAVSHHEQGELRVQTKLKFSGYYKLEMSDHFDSEGWLRTGDILYYDEDNFFYFVERLKEVLKYKGTQIVPAVLEKHLMNHPNVHEVVVVGIPDEEGEVPVAIVVKEKNSDLSVEEVMEYVEKDFEDVCKLRGGVKFVESLPKTHTGKFARKELKNMILSKII